jgi:hypothetical protein
MVREMDSENEDENVVMFALEEETVSETFDGGQGASLFDANAQVHRTATL